MDNQEISRLKARGKAELLAFVLFLTLLGGGGIPQRNCFFGDGSSRF